MCVLKSKYSWLTAPVLWLAGTIALISVWAASTPVWIDRHFDYHGISPVESATIGLYFFMIGLLWSLPPMRPGRRRVFWSADFTLITFFAVCRELDWHKMLVKTSGLPDASHGTAFKMKFLTNTNNPLSDRIIVALCFLLVFAVCGFTLVYFLRRLLTGLFAFHPVCWSIGFLGGATILVQFADRLPAVLRHKYGIVLSDSLHAFCTTMEEGQELLMPLFVILAIIQAHFIYNDEPSDREELLRFKDL